MALYDPEAATSTTTQKENKNLATRGGVPSQPVVAPSPQLVALTALHTPVFPGFRGLACAALHLGGLCFSIGSIWKLQWAVQVK